MHILPKHRPSARNDRIEVSRMYVLAEISVGKKQVRGS